MELEWLHIPLSKLIRQIATSVMRSKRFSFQRIQLQRELLHIIAN